MRFLKKMLFKKILSPKGSWNKPALSQDPALQVIDVGIEMANIIREVNAKEAVKVSESNS